MRPSLPWRTAIRIVVVVIVAFAVLYLAGFAVEHFGSSRYMNATFGFSPSLSRPVFKYDSGRTFGGDGYTLYVYTLPATLRARFASPDESFLQSHPKTPPLSGKWQVEHWRCGPIDPDLSHLLSAAMPLIDADRSAPLNAQFDEIRKALQSESTYYCFCHHGGFADVHMIVVDTQRDRLFHARMNM